jgi:hypothetical protein
MKLTALISTDDFLENEYCMLRLMILHLYIFRPHIRFLSSYIFPYCLLLYQSLSSKSDCLRHTMLE